ncbi:MAG TPA: hypothetical protein PLS87_11310 [Ferruginibacter sp.]|uniref:hypothetical protein n=1 Tax=Agriterribacter sp. TaxID=2821509 RepID=UPI002BF7E4E6|nr:hypothetical protein [Agriterribacter sp.]HMM15985.1 hypothetical protein [Petrimonas sp.]HRN93000.1 hypothetical protein [Ferruginibacter sp.]HRQ19306.1 hypothetical protein [Agriterribacter sp.]
MKTTVIQFLSFIMLVSCTVMAQQKQSFDIISYDKPKGWQQSSTTQTLTMSKEDKSGNYCTITLSKSVEAEADAQTNFNHSWKGIAMNNLGAGKVTMQPGTTDNGWKTLMGSAPFEKDGLKGAAILINSSKSNKMVNILILTNTDKFQKEMETFLDGITLSGTTSAKKTANNKQQQTGTNSTENNSQPEVWMNMQYKSISNDFSPMGKIKPRFYVIYPNGDYYPHFPPEGLLTFSNVNKNGSWGTFTIEGNKGKFQSKYESIEVEKISATQMKKTGYTFSFYKCVSVDGLTLEGQWGSFPEWRKDPIHGNPNGFNGSGMRGVIEFKKDGSFIDYGIFVTNLNLSRQYPAKAPGKGTYSIRNFTLLLKYDDGRNTHKAFTGVADKDPAVDSKVIYIGTNPFFSK